MGTKHAVQIILSAVIVVSQLVIESTQEPVKNCGDVSQQVEVCAKPLMEILEGTIESWPRSEKDVERYCREFAVSELCIRDLGRRCTKGLQRTIISTVANSVQRTRKRECTNSKYPMLLKTYQAIEKVQVGTRDLITNTTIKLSVVDSQMKDVDEKVNALCCTIDDVQALIKFNMGEKFPNEAKVVLSIYTGILQDMLELICRSPKCNDIFRGYEMPEKRPEGGLINMVLNIMFSIQS